MSTLERWRLTDLVRASFEGRRSTRSFEGRDEVLLDNVSVAEGLPNTADCRRRRWWWWWRRKRRQWKPCRSYDNVGTLPTRAIFRAILALVVLVPSWKSEQTRSPSTPDSGVLLEYERASATPRQMTRGQKDASRGEGRAGGDYCRQQQQICQGGLT